MKEEQTTELLDILNKLETSQMDHYIARYGKTEKNNSIFSEYFAEHDIKTSDVVKKCEGMLSKSYIYDILNGNKTNPARDILLILCIVCGMDRKFTRRILENYGQRDLYAKDTRDIIIATYINNKIYDIQKINDELYRYGLPVLNEM